MLSERAKSLKPSATLKLTARARELASQGKDIISLSVGEPDWPTTQVASDRAILAIKNGQTKYAPSNGIPELREEVVRQLANDIGVKYKPEQVTVSIGGKFILQSAIQSLINPNDEVIIPAPYWVSYPTLVEMAGGRPVIVATTQETGFKLTAAQLKKAITPKTKAVIFNSPSNPTGEIYTQNELSEIAKVLEECPNVVIITDDIYNKLVFDGLKMAPHLLAENSPLIDRTLIVNGASKTYSMTGWRVGWAVGPTALIKAMTDYQSQTVTCTPLFCQLAAVEALKAGDHVIRDAMAELETRREVAFTELKKIPGFSGRKPSGAFYFWIPISNWLGKANTGEVVSNSTEFCQLLLERYGVSAVPGVEFGCEGYFRLSYAIKVDRLKEAVTRIAKLVNTISR